MTNVLLDGGMAVGNEMIVLMDNGSLRAEATLQLRVLAKELSARLERPVSPVSLLHSGKVNQAKLGGMRAQTLVPFLRAQRELGIHRFIVLPLFFGPSGALVDYLPKRIQNLQDDDWPELEVRVAATLVHESDNRIAKIMAKLVREKITECGWMKPAVAMCDHGTPAKIVNEARELVVSQLKILLGDAVSVIKSCSMERRDGTEYNFNEPLLERLLGTADFDRQVVISMLFASPGRHAGEEGDVAQICEGARNNFAQLETALTSLVGTEIDMLVSVLEDRFIDSYNSIT